MTCRVLLLVVAVMTGQWGLRAQDAVQQCPVLSPCLCRHWDSPAYRMISCLHQKLTDTGLRAALASPQPAASIQLSAVDLRGNSLQALPESLLDQLYGVHTLSLGANNIKQVPSSALQHPSLAGLNSLRLDHNPIEYLNTSAFPQLAHVRMADLSRCNIQTIAAGVFSAGLHSLHTLVLSANKLVVLRAGTFDGLERMTSLSLPDNILQGLEKGWIPVGNKLNTLNLNDNHFSNLTADMFSSLHVLKKLYLINNRIQHLDRQVFSSLGRLQQLHLKDNLLNHLDGQIFDQCSRLGRLDVSNNPITTFAPESFPLMPTLTFMNLNGNRINNISGEFSSENFSILKDLYLEGLRMRQLPNLSKLSGLATLLISQSLVSSIPQCNLDMRQLPGFKRLSWSSSPVDCNCDLNWLRLHIQSLPPDDLGSYGTIICQSPAALRGHTLHLTNSSFFGRCPPVVSDCTAVKRTTATTSLDHTTISVAQTSTSTAELSAGIKSDATSASATTSGASERQQVRVVTRAHLHLMVTDVSASAVTVQWSCWQCQFVGLTVYSLSYHGKGARASKAKVLVEKDIHQYTLSSLQAGTVYNICITVLTHSDNASTDALLPREVCAQTVTSSDVIVILCSSIGAGVFGTSLASFVALCACRRRKARQRSHSLTRPATSQDLPPAYETSFMSPDGVFRTPPASGAECGAGRDGDRATGKVHFTDLTTEDQGETISYEI